MLSCCSAVVDDNDDDALGAGPTNGCRSLMRSAVFDVAGDLKPSLPRPALPGQGAPYSGALALI